MAAFVVLVVIIIAVAMLGLNNKEKEPATQEEIETAENLQKHYPDKSVNEIIDIGKEELTEDQTEKIGIIIENHTLPEVDEVISTPEDQDLTEEKPEVVYKDIDGNTVIWELEDEVVEATDEDLDEDINAILEDMRKQTDEYLSGQGTDNIPTIPIIPTKQMIIRKI